MTRKEDLRVGDHDMYVAIESCTGVPAAVGDAACVGAHGQHIVLTPAQQLGHVSLKTEVAIIRLANGLSVEPGITCVEYSFEI